jgi:RNA ligase (TIGR02306 family)
MQNMEKSTHKCEVVEVHPIAHPNADKLEVCSVFGYVCCVQKGQFKDGDLAAYVPPDSVVDSARPEFSFCAGHERIRVKKLRGVVSMGLLVAPPPGAKLGDDVAEALGVKHFEPPIKWSMSPGPGQKGLDDGPPPKGVYAPTFDVDALRRYSNVFEDGEPVWITEKIHGANARYCFVDGQMMAGSKTKWKLYSEMNMWWRALAAHPEIQLFCQNHPGVVVYGEAYGCVQDLKYGLGQGQVKIAVFDIMRNGAWVDANEAVNMAPGLPWAPSLCVNMPYNAEAIYALAEGPSLIPGANHMREGIVVKPLKERVDQKVGRVCMKVVSTAYLES